MVVNHKRNYFSYYYIYRRYNTYIISFSGLIGIRGIKNRLRSYIDEAIWEDPAMHTIEVA